jgi:signal transduction histidine kinase
VTATGAAPDELLDAWAALAAHQLGEAMSLVGGYAALLREQYAGALGPGGDDALQGMLNGADRLRRYVDDLLDLQHASDPIAGTADLDATLAEAVGKLQEFIGRARARVDSAALGRAAVAPEKAERLFAHLLRDALAAGARRVDVEAQPGDGTVAVTVSDDGEAVDAERAAGLLEPFARPRGHGPLVGAGVGLTVCRRIVQTAGGDIAAGPASAGGLRVTVSLPEP